METFKQLLAFPLYATVAWLAWILGALGGNDAIFALLAGLVLVAMGAWFYGRWAHAGGIWQPAIAVMLGAVGIAVAWPGQVAPQEVSHAAPKAGELAWQPWSPEEVRRLTDGGQPVFVDFTAAWCVTCQVNKRVALNNADVVKAFRNGQASLHDVYDWWDRCLIDEMLSDEGNAFAQSYFDFERGEYMKDYARVLQRDLPSEFHVPFTEANYQAIRGVIDVRYAAWTQSSRP